MGAFRSDKQPQVPHEKASSIGQCSLCLNVALLYALGDLLKAGSGRAPACNRSSGAQQRATAHNTIQPFSEANSTRSSPMPCASSAESSKRQVRQIRAGHVVLALRHPHSGCPKPVRDVLGYCAGTKCVGTSPKVAIAP